LGTTVSDLVTFELKHISELHNPDNLIWSFKGESLPQEQIVESQSFQQVGSVSVAGTVIPLGELLLALKSTWPHFGERSVISGSVHSFATESGQQHIKIIARRESQGKILNQWSINQAIAEQIEIAEIAKDLAYQIHHETGINIQTTSWQSFKYLSEAIEPAKKYFDGFAADDLAEAKRLLHAALQHDESYIIARYALGQLYYQNAFYQWEEENDDRNLRPSKDIVDSEALLAKKEFEQIVVLAEKPKEKALGYFGLGMLCADQAQLTPCRWREICGKEARAHFKDATDADPDFWEASWVLTVMLEKEDRFEDAVNELQGLKKRTQLKESTLSAVDERIAKLGEMSPGLKSADPDCEDDPDEGRSDEDWWDEGWPDEPDDWGDDN